MSKRKHKGGNGLNKQGIRSLDYLPSKPRGIRLELPPSMVGDACNHPDYAIEYDHESGMSQCKRCRCAWDFDGKAI